MSELKNSKKGKDVGPKELEKRIQELAFTIDRVEDEKLEVENQLKRALADYHNLLKSSQKRETLKLQQMRRDLFETIIPTLDSLLFATVASKDVKMDEKGKSWLDGILATIESMQRDLEKLGFEQYIPQKGDKFDRDLHEAIATVQEGKKGKIYEMIQPGYILNDSVVRPARVVVSK